MICSGEVEPDSEFLGGDVDQHLALADGLSLGDMDVFHQAIHLGAQHHPFVGLQVADVGGLLPDGLRCELDNTNVGVALAGGGLFPGNITLFLAPRGLLVADRRVCRTLVSVTPCECQGHGSEQQQQAALERGE